MNILITNDDGIENIGIRLLAEWAKKLGEVTVVAPKVEQSAKSHAIDFITPVEIKKVDLIKYISIPVMTDFIQVSSYTGTSRSREVKLIKDLTYNVEGRTLILIDDVVDSGNSLYYLVKHLYQNYKPKKVLTCALFDKVNAREADIEVDYSGKLLQENAFLCGYGLDYNEVYRNVPYVFVPDKEELETIDNYLKSKGEEF